jgi:hypothetical protein
MLTVTPIKRVLEKTGRDIVVPEGREITVGPEEREFAELFSLVEIRSFADLQDLTLIPQGLDEKRVLQAIADDDAEALSAARNYLQPQSKSGGCDCLQSEEGTPLKLHYRSDLRTTYNGIRKTQNPHLSRLLSDLYSKPIEWDSPISAHILWWMLKKNALSAIRGFVLKPKNITILSNATLSLSASTKLLWANDIRIHAGGKLKSNSSYMKIKCNSVQGNI